MPPAPWVSRSLRRVLQGATISGFALFVLGFCREIEVSAPIPDGSVVAVTIEPGSTRFGLWGPSPFRNQKSMWHFDTHASRGLRFSWLQTEFMECGRTGSCFPNGPTVWFANLAYPHALVSLFAGFGLIAWDMSRRRPPFICDCGYELRGLTASTCPECGRACSINVGARSN